jgi:hypothetical protein
LEGAAFDTEGAGCGADAASAFLEHAVEVFPFHAPETGRGHFCGGRRSGTKERALDLVGIGGFGKIIRCSDAHGVDGCSDTPISGEHKHTHLRVEFSKPPHKIQAALPGHFEIDNSRSRLPSGGQSLPDSKGTACRPNREPAFFKRPGKAFKKWVIVINQQNLSAGCTHPSAGNINVNFTPSTTPVLRPLTEWSPGNWFDASASWAPDISPTVGSVFGMPVGNAGDGDLFNNRYGFMFMSMGSMMMANVPSGKSLAIRLDSATSVDLKSFNYGNADNRWDQVFDGANSQVLWNGTMWHNYFTMPAPTAPGTYTAIFEVFIANTPFTGTTGFAQYDATALAATKDSNFNSAFVTYDFSVIPEPSALALGMLALLGSLAGGRSRKIV